MIVYDNVSVIIVLIISDILHLDTLIIMFVTVSEVNNLETIIFSSLLSLLLLLLLSMAQLNHQINPVTDRTTETQTHSDPVTETRPNNR